MVGLFGTPTPKGGGFSVLRRSLRHGSPKGLPGPLYVLRRVVVPMQTCPALWAGMPADGQALLDHAPHSHYSVCEVNAGLTAMTLRPAHAALCVRMMRNAPHPASVMRLG